MKKVLIVLLACLLLLASCKDKELIEKVDNLSKTVEILTEENRVQKASIAKFESDIVSVRKDIAEISDSIQFDVPDYPIRYELTDKSLEDFKTMMLESAKLFANELGVTEEELAEGLAILGAMDTRDLLENLFDDFEEGSIVVLNESQLYTDGYTEDYRIDENGKLYVDGYLFGTIDDDVLTFSVEEDGINVYIKFYRTSPKSDEKMSLADKIKSMEKKIDESYSYLFY